MSSLCCEFHVNISLGFGRMTKFVYKGLTRNPVKFSMSEFTDYFQILKKYEGLKLYGL